MKNIDNISEFEHLFKKEMSGHSTPPPADAWANVATSTAGKSASILSQASSFVGSATNLLKIALFAGGIAAVGIVVYNENSGVAISPDNTETSTEANKENQKQTALLQDIEIRTAELKTEDIQAKTAKKSPTSSTEKTTNTQTPETIATNTSGEQKLAAANTAHTTLKNTADEATDVKPLYFEISNPKPCLGDEIILKSQLAGSWYQDGTLLASNTNIITTTVTKKGATILSLIVEETKTSKIIDVQSSEAQIVSATQDGKYLFSLSDKNQIANWYIDSKLLATNAKECSTTLNKVGQHNIRAVVINNPCTAPTSITLETKPVGKITTYDIITIDGDGKNDEYAVEIEGYENYSIQIFDPTTNTEVFYTKDPVNMWNGRRYNDGVECPAGSYVAKISYTLIGEAPITKNIKLTLKRP
jgi:hypothetical protein